MKLILNPHLPVGSVTGGKFYLPLGAANYRECDRWCLPKSTLSALGIDLDLIRGCYTWTGVCWKKVDCIIARLQAVWLEVEETATEFCLVRFGGKVPYNTDKYSGLQWSDDAACIMPVVTAQNGQEAWEQMPSGTRVYVARYPDGQTLLRGYLTRFALMDALSEQGRQMNSHWPAFWGCSDTETGIPLFVELVLTPELLAKLALFTIPIEYAGVTQLPKPATKWLDVLVLIPPGYQWDTMIQPL